MSAALLVNHDLRDGVHQGHAMMNKTFLNILLMPMFINHIIFVLHKASECLHYELGLFLPEPVLASQYRHAVIMVKQN